MTPVPRAVLLALLLTAGGCSGAPRDVQVAAAVSLRTALLDLKEPFEARHPDLHLRFYFAASGVLERQAREGAPFDLVAFAGTEELERLTAAERLVPGTRRLLASNRLVVAIPADGVLPAALGDLADPTFARIAVGSPTSVPLGRYARQALEAAGLWSALQPRLVFASHAEQVMRYLARGEVDAGFAYGSDARGAEGVQVALEVDGSLHEPIDYAAALVQDGPNLAGGRQLLDLLAGPLGEVVFRKHGFGPPR